MPFAAVPLDGDQAGVDQYPQVPGRGGPGVGEAGGEFAGGHGAAAGVHHLEDVPAGVVRQRAEDGVEVVEVT